MYRWSSTCQLSAFIHIHQQVSARICTHATWASSSTFCSFSHWFLDLSWVQQSSSPSTYYQSASSLTFRKEEDKKGREQDSGRGRRAMAISAFHVKQQWIIEAGLAFPSNTVSVIWSVITVLNIRTPHCSCDSFCCSNCWSLRSQNTFYFIVYVCPIFDSA